MSATLRAVVASPRPPARAPVGLDRSFRWKGLLWVLLCGLPAAGLLMLGKLTLAANCFWMVLAVVVIWLIVTGQPQMLIGLLVGVMPFINLMRGYGFAFYNAPLMVLAVGVGHYFFRAPQALRQTWTRCSLVVWLCGLTGFYYVVSVFNTGDYSSNLRFFELCLSVLCVLLAGRSRQVIGVGLLGLTISACAIGLAMLPYNQTVGRLGMVEIEGQIIGNPVQLGMALALGLLTLTADRGQWLNLPGSGWWRRILFVPIGGLLVLTTSRAAWLVTTAGLLLVAVFGRRQRLQILLVAGSVAVAILIAEHTALGPGMQAGFERTFSPDRSADNRTSGRSDQWVVAYHAATASWDRMLWGYGPGRGAIVYAYYSQRVEGVSYDVGRVQVLHSLFMQVMVEAGALGLVVLCAWLLIAFWKTVQWTWKSGQLVPLIGICGYGLMILTGTGNDTVSGLMLGLGLLATSEP